MDIGGMASPIDALDYQYAGNQLLTVDDEEGSNFENYGFKDNGIFEAVEYEYDNNGNMTLDKNKGIDQIAYNYLNLPVNIVFNNGLPEEKSIGYLYTATGTKLQKHTHLNNNAEGARTDYIGAFVYEDNELQFIQTTEGRLVPNGSGGFNYEYAIKDHLGNTRVMFSQTGQVLQDQSYYPFGLSMGEALTFDMPSSLPDNKYLYNGKELQDDFGLGWYDYGARFYDPAIARWHVVDPHAENYYSWSPYHFSANNPIRITDPTGMDWYDVNSTITWHDQEGDLTIDDQTYQSLGKNVLVGTHNRDENGNEDINSATFSLYLESNKEGATATIEGNTVPGDIEKQGTLAEGLYDADYAEYKGKPAILIGKGGDLPTTDGNPNNPDNYNADGSMKPVSEHVMDEIFFHKGNIGRERLWYQKPNGEKGYISEGCQTGPNGQGSLLRYQDFMKNVDKSFSGKYYLRGRK